MIHLHTFPPLWGMRSLTPFGIKVDVFLRFAGLDFKTIYARTTSGSPKGKLPYIVDDGERIADSSMILDHLRKKYSLEHLFRLQEGLPEVVAFHKMVEESLYYVMLYSRWVDPRSYPVLLKTFRSAFPPGVGRVVLHLTRRRLRRQAWVQGIGRHRSEEIYQMGAQQLESLSRYLDTKPFFAGEELQAIDATMYAFLKTIEGQAISSPLQDYLMQVGDGNLSSYIKRVELPLGFGQNRDEILKGKSVPVLDETLLPGDVHL